MPLIYIVYVSSARRLLEQHELLDLLGRARAHNAREAITGVLLYHEGNFLQVLEGPEAAVDRLYRKIQDDPRHRGVIQLLSGRLATRSFAAWAMAFRTLDALPADARPDVRELLAEATTTLDRAIPRPQGDHARRIRRLLQSFKQVACLRPPEASNTMLLSIRNGPSPNGVLTDVLISC